MGIKTVEFICDENMAAPETLPTPRPVDRPRPSPRDLKTGSLSVQSFEDDSAERSPAQLPTKKDATT